MFQRCRANRVVSVEEPLVYTDNNVGSQKMKLYIARVC